MTTATKLSARQAWLSVALGVADGLPHPSLMQVIPHPDHDQVTLTLDTASQAQQWRSWLGYTESGSVELPDGTVLWHWRGERQGWSYTLYATEPAALHEPVEDAKARLVAAVLSPDEEA